MGASLLALAKPIYYPIYPKRRAKMVGVANKVY